MASLYFPVKSRVSALHYRHENPLKSCSLWRKNFSVPCSSCSDRHIITMRSKWFCYERNLLCCISFASIFIPTRGATEMKIICCTNALVYVMLPLPLNYHWTTTELSLNYHWTEHPWTYSQHFLPYTSYSVHLIMFSTIFYARNNNIRIILHELHRTYLTSFSGILGITLLSLFPRPRARDETAGFVYISLPPSSTIVLGQDIELILIPTRKISTKLILHLCQI